MDYISVSQVTTYLACPLQYFFRYVEKREPERTSDALVFGNAVHDAVLLSVQRTQNGQAMTREQVELAFADFWSARVSTTPDIEYGRNSFDELLHKGLRMVGCYVDQAPKAKVIAIEEEIRPTIPHPDGDVDVPLLGYIDLLVDDGGDLPIVVELKTAGARFNDQRLRTDLQATAYCLAIAQKHGTLDKEVPFRWHVLLKTREPILLTYEVTRTERDYLRFGMLVKKVIDGVRNGIFFPQDGSWRCGGCAYRTACKAWSPTKVSTHALACT